MKAKRGMLLKASDPNKVLYADLPTSSLPTKEFALQMAEYYHHHKCPLMMWDWLVVWGFYEMYVSYK